jgi:NAD(P)-dependent dehydrogenase (short-subunit alcohol dehydrogenase family)
MHSLKNSLSFVSGSTQGIGLAIARAFVKKGEQVVVHGRTEAKSREAAEIAGARAFVWGDLSSTAGAVERSRCETASPDDSLLDD